MNFLYRHRQKKPFCLAPWVQSHIDTDGQRRLCCAAKPAPQEVQGGGFKDFWNSTYMRRVRTKMLRSEYLPECENCHQTGRNYRAYKDHFNFHFGGKFKSVVNATGANGSYSGLPVSFDYRFSNLCNFKCRMCGESNSSAWQKENMIDQAKDLHVSKPRQGIKKFQEQFSETEFANAIDMGRVEEIYWAGGEPLLWPQHWNLMNKMVESGRAKKISVRYNTNLSVLSYKDIHLFELLKHFRSFSIQASLDATQTLGEFIRTGLKWNEWLENFHSCLEFSRRTHNSTNLDVTLTLPGLFGLIELAKFCADVEVAPFLKVCLAEDSSQFMSPYILPKNILHPFIYELLDELTHLVIEENPRGKWIHPFNRILIQMLQHPVFSQTYPDWQEGLRIGIKKHLRLQRIRQDGINGRLTLEKVFAARPTVLAWYQENCLKFSTPQSVGS